MSFYLPCEKNTDCPSGTQCVNGNCTVIPGIAKCSDPGHTCPGGSACDPVSGLCKVIPGIIDCRTSGVECPPGTQCDQSGACVQVLTPIKDCRIFGCGLGGVCNTSSGVCENGGGVPDTTNLCASQHNFDNAVYKALKYVRKKDEKLMAGPLAVYMIIHMIFLVWGVVLAFKSQPPANRTIHITLAMVFGPAYVLAYYLNAF